MNKIGILLFTTAIALTTLSACTSDDEPTTIPEEKNLLLGKWNATATHLKVEMDGKILTDNLYDEEGSMHGIIKTYEFKTDNTVDYYTYIPANGSNEARESTGTTTYERNDNQLVLKNYPHPYTILVSSENKLHLYNTFEVASEGTSIKTESIDKFEKIK